jgi:hypothetical protein
MVTIKAHEKHIVKTSTNLPTSDKMILSPVPYSFQIWSFILKKRGAKQVSNVLNLTHTHKVRTLITSPIVVGIEKYRAGPIVSSLSVLFNDAVNGALVELYWQGKTTVLREKPASEPLCPTKNPTMAWNRTRVPRREQPASALTRPVGRVARIGRKVTINCNTTQDFQHGRKFYGTQYNIEFNVHYM